MVIRRVWLRRAWMSIAASPSLPRTTGSPTVLPSWVIVAPGEVGWAEMGVAMVDLLDWDARPSRLRGAGRGFPIRLPGSRAYGKTVRPPGARLGPRRPLGRART